jgi:hypothetical protein
MCLRCARSLGAIICVCGWSIRRAVVVFTACVCGNVVLLGDQYRCPDGPDTTGGTTHDTKKHDTNTMDVVSVAARHDGWPVSGPPSQHVVPARTRHEKDGPSNTTLAHLNTIVAHLNPAYQPTNVVGPPIQHIYTSNPNPLLSFFQSCRRRHPPSVSLPPPPLHRFIRGPCGGSTAAVGRSRKAAAIVGAGFGGGHAPLPWGAVGRRGSVVVLEWAVGSIEVGRRRSGQALPSWMRQRGRRAPLPWGAAIRPPGRDFVSLFL